jgi:hypothetical protein
VTDFYSKDVGFDSRVMHGFFLDEKDVEDIDLKNQPSKQISKICLERDGYNLLIKLQNVTVSICIKEGKEFRWVSNTSV